MDTPVDSGWRVTFRAAWNRPGRPGLRLLDWRVLSGQDGQSVDWVNASIDGLGIEAKERSSCWVESSATSEPLKLFVRRRGGRKRRRGRSPLCCSIEIDTVLVGHAMHSHRLVSTLSAQDPHPQIPTGRQQGVALLAWPGLWSSPVGSIEPKGQTQRVAVILLLLLLHPSFEPAPACSAAPPPAVVARRRRPWEQCSSSS